MVNACFPQACERQNAWSKLNAIRGKYPVSSKRVKSGKNIAIGGSITETTLANTRQTPSISRF